MCIEHSPTAFATFPTIIYMYIYIFFLLFFAKFCENNADFFKMFFTDYHILLKFWQRHLS